MASAREQGKVLCFCASAAAARGEKVSRRAVMNPASVSGSVAGEGGDDLPFGRRPGKVFYFCAVGEEAAAQEEKGSLKAEATVENTRREKRRELFLRTNRSSVSVAAGGRGSGDLPCADSPRSLISRLLLSSIRKRPTGRIRTREEKAMAAEAEELPPQPRDTPVDGSEIDAGKDYSSGKKTDELCLNLGMGFALSFLLTRNSSEINKMIELRKQMEILLEEIKVHRSPKRLESRNNQNYNSSASGKFSFHEPETESKSARDFKNRRNDLKMEEELMELVAEPSQDDSEEKSLHGGVSAKELSVRLNQLVQTRQKEGIAEFESSFHCTDHEGSDNGEVNTDFDGGDGKVFAGVSAPELEKKLHELLDSRQKERIMALESALERTKLKLHEKEREACRWRYNARLISER